ncbi:MAG: DUF5702 domain-containing protein [Lachnospiraceae bacterium]|nr:DUF5702 domain-containing protein [Lachnospiraceae bacterium]
MNRLKRKKTKIISGVLSVYLALMIAVMIPIILTMIEGARISAMRTKIGCAADLAMDSALAEYNRELLKQYDLLFIDTAYDSGMGSLDNTREHMLDYLSYNIDPGRDNFLMGGADFLRLECDGLEFTGVSRATDDDGAVFRYMALSYMLEKYGLAYAEDVKDMAEKSESSGLYDGDIGNEESDAQQELDDYEFEAPQVDDGNGGKMDDPDWSEPEKADPAGKVNNLRGGGILSLVCGHEISSESVDADIYASHRDLVAGDGMYEEWDDREGIMYEMLFNEYIMEKAGNYLNEKPGSRLKYEVEYIYAGKDSDDANLGTVVNRILLIRGAVNTIYFFGDGELQAESNELAAALAAASMSPELEPIYLALIDAAWIYAESASDIRVLMTGGKLPVIMSPGDWRLSLEGALDATEDMIESSVDDGSGKDMPDDPANMEVGYEGYLRLLLYTVSRENRVGRMMDIVEMDVRMVPGYEAFRLDDCIAAATIQFTFKSDYGYEFFVERNMRYM